MEKLKYSQQNIIYAVGARATKRQLVMILYILGSQAQRFSFHWIMQGTTEKSP